MYCNFHFPLTFPPIVLAEPSAKKPSAKKPSATKPSAKPPKRRHT